MSWPPTFQGARTDASTATPNSHADDHTTLDQADQDIVTEIERYETANDAAVAAKLDASEKGAANGVASLDGSGNPVEHDPTKLDASTTLDAVPAPVADVAFNGHKAANLADPTNPQDAATRAYVLAQINALIGAAPGALDTLNELATALGDDPNFATTITNALAGKQPLDSELTALAALISDADKLPYFTGSGTAALTNFTALARTILGLATVADIQTALSLVPGVNVQAFDTGLDSLRIAYAGVDVPKHALDRARGPYRPVSTRLSSAVSTTTTPFISVVNPELTRPNVIETFAIIDANGTVEEVTVFAGQETTALTVKRGVNGTTAVTHAAGARVVARGYLNWLALGDSTIAGDDNNFEPFVTLLRREADARFGGSLGLGYYGLFRNASDSSISVAPEWVLGGTWNIAAYTAIYSSGPWLSRSAAGSTANTLIFAVPAEGSLAMAELFWTEYTGTDNHWSWSYSYDNGSTYGINTGGVFVASSWADNPNPPSYPTATSTLASADNGRSLSYWDGTKTMTIGSTTGYPTCGYFRLTTSSGTATFFYAGVGSSTVLNNVLLVRGSGSWTSATSQVVQIESTLKKSKLTGFVDTSGNPVNPTHIQIRAANAAGTGKSCLISGIRLWNTIPVWGETTGIMVDNCGYDAHLLADLLNSFTFDDFSITSTTTLTSATANFGPAVTGMSFIGPGIPAGTTITFVNSTTCTLSQACTNGTNLTCTFGGNGDTTGSWGRLFDGHEASLVPDLVIGQFTNDMDLTEWAGRTSNAANGTCGARLVTGSITSNVLTVTAGALTAQDVGKVLSGGTITGGTTITGFTDSTRATVSTTPDQGSEAIVIGASEAEVNAAIVNNLAALNARVSPYADLLVHIAFEQGSTRLDGTHCTSARQASYRLAEYTWAHANGVASLDYYKAWSAEGIVGYVQALAAGYMDSANGGFHQAALGNRNQASRDSRVLADF